MRALAVTLFLSMAAFSVGALAISIEARGLFANGAILIIDGKQKMLKVGNSYGGVKLLEASSKKALVEFDGQQRTIFLSTRISSNFKEPKEVEVRLQSSQGGHYVAPGRINSQRVTMMVDTGATAVSMSSEQAEAINLDYLNGERVRLSTANGSAIGYRVMLDRVSVGSVEVTNVEAIVNEGGYPEVILLGNSYLSRVGMARENGVLVLQSKF